MTKAATLPSARVTPKPSPHVLPDAKLTVTEMGCASALLAAGARFLGAVPGARVKLLFDDSDGAASELLAEHRTGTLEVSSLRITQALNEIKSIVFSHGTDAWPHKTGERPHARDNDAYPDESDS